MSDRKPRSAVPAEGSAGGWSLVGRLLGLPVASIAATAGVVVLIAVWVDGVTADWVRQIVLAAAVAGVGALLGSAAIVYVWRRAYEHLTEGVLAAVACRLAGTLGLVLLLHRAGWGLGQVFFMCTAGFYVIGLVIEAVLAIRLHGCGRWDGSRVRNAHLNGV